MNLYSTSTLYTRTSINRAAGGFPNLGYCNDGVTAFTDLPTSSVTRVGQKFEACHVLICKTVGKTEYKLTRIAGAPVGTLVSRLYRGCCLITTFGSICAVCVCGEAFYDISCCCNCAAIQACDRIVVVAVSGCTTNAVRMKSTGCDPHANTQSTFFTCSWQCTLCAFDVNMKVFYA